MVSGSWQLAGCGSGERSEGGGTGGLSVYLRRWPRDRFESGTAVGSEEEEEKEKGRQDGDRWM